MVAEDLNKQTGIRGGLLIGIGQEHQPAANFSGGELVFGQLQGFHLGPVMGDILQILGIDGNLAQ